MAKSIHLMSRGHFQETVQSSDPHLLSGNKRRVPVMRNIVLIIIVNLIELSHLLLHHLLERLI